VPAGLLLELTVSRLQSVRVGACEVARETDGGGLLARLAVCTTECVTECVTLPAREWAREWARERKEPPGWLLLPAGVPSPPPPRSRWEQCDSQREYAGLDARLDRCVMSGQGSEAATELVERVRRLPIDEAVSERGGEGWRCELDGGTASGGGCEGAVTAQELPSRSSCELPSALVDCSE